MKRYTTYLLLLVSSLAFAQADLPLFLEGTWKMENEDSYEHWDLLNGQALKGVGYRLSDGQMAVSEYMDIVVTKKRKVVYAATVVKQNGGKRVEFLLRKSGEAYVFENFQHDFPKRIAYQQLNNALVQVTLSGDGEQSIGYKLVKQAAASPAEPDTTVANPNYDPALAKQYGGDDYGMKGFVLVLLKTGPNTSTDKAFINEQFRGHMENIHRLVAEEKLVVAGPLGKNDHKYRGIFILNNVGDLDAARELLLTDPAIASGLLEADVFNWYGSAALPAYLPFSDKIWKLQP